MATTTPPTSPKRHEYDTIKRTRFFNAFDSKENGQGVGSIAKLPDIDIPPSTARLWLKQRDILGDAAFRSQRKTSSRLGRKSKVSESDVDRLLNQEDPIHELHYEKQRLLLPGLPSQRTLRRHTAARGARRFKKPFMTEVSGINKQKRVKYGQEHQDKNITGYWQWIWWTDEVHFQSIKLQNAIEYELRLPGQEGRHQNPHKSTGLDVTLHVSAGVSYDHKGPLIFYKDPQEPSEKVRKAAPPRRSKYDTDQSWQERKKLWDDQQPREPPVPKGNCMTQAFYAKEILPRHIKEIKMLEARHKHRYYLQEDGDPSHGNRSQNNPCQRLKRDSDLLIHTHPPQSPDLNPIEACWNILKQRLRGRQWKTMAEFKADILAEWDKITLTQIRRRIKEMPNRCRKVQASNGERISSSLW
jgi:hypothetical protein